MNDPNDRGRGFTTPSFRHSLLVRLAFAMGTIVGLSFFGLLSAVVIAELLHGQATAINQAGALRMQTYLVGTRLLEPHHDPELRRQNIHAAMDKFEQRVAADGLIDALPRSTSAPTRMIYNRILDDWQNVVRPLMSRHAEDHPDGSVDPAHPLTADLDRFVATVNRFVFLLERDAENKVYYLRLTQVISLFLTIVVVGITMYLMHKRILTPLRALLTAADRARHGDFSAQVAHTGNDELGQLGEAFNVMTNDLSRIYMDLEDRVRTKTIELERSNRTLEVLYNTLAHLSSPSLSPENYVNSLREIEQLLDIGPSVLCLMEKDSGKGFRLATTPAFAERGEVYCDQAACQACICDGPAQLTMYCEGDPTCKLVVPIKDREQRHGVLVIQVPQSVELEAWQIHLIEAVSKHIAIAITSQRRLAQDRRLALLEERSTIARELHDSLAQSLSYLKIQVTRLQEMAGGNGSSAQQTQVIHDLREGLNSAYRGVRELIATFRLKMDSRTLSAALREAAQEISAHGDIDIRVDNRLIDGLLTVNEEIHVLQIAREALANIVQHSGARNGWISLDVPGKGRVVMTVADDGLGFDPETVQPTMHHFGLTIMQERAHHLGGDLEVRSRPGGGTEVVLDFRYGIPRSRAERPPQSEAA